MRHICNDSGEVERFAKVLDSNRKVRLAEGYIFDDGGELAEQGSQQTQTQSSSFKEPCSQRPRIFITKQDTINSSMSKDTIFTDESIVQILINRKQLFDREDAMAVLESRPAVSKSLYILNTLCRHEVLPKDVFAYLKDNMDQNRPSRVELLKMVLAIRTRFFVITPNL
jgi:hypothetical protein